MREKQVLVKLEKEYGQLMKKSFELSIKNPAKSDECHRKAIQILEEIHSLSGRKEVQH